MDIFHMYSKDEILDYIQGVFPESLTSGVYRLLEVSHTGTTLDMVAPYLSSDHRLFYDYFVLGMLLPLDRLPLHINASNSVLRQVVKLRLQRGR